MLLDVKAREVLGELRRRGCEKSRQRGSHQRWDSPDGQCHTTVPVHKGEDIPRGTLRAIERDMEPCLGKGWLLGR